MRPPFALTALGLSFAILRAAPGAVIHVDASAPPGGDGASWATAMNDLRAALLGAAPGDSVHVVRGVYFATTGTDATLNFRVFNGVKLLGGFAGTEADPSERAADPDPESADPAHDTILSGEIGTPDIADNTQNVLVVEGAFAGSGTLVDRLVMTRGVPGTTFPANRGGGARISNATMTVRDVLFVDNAGSEGAGLWVQSGAPTLERCVFRDNQATGYGAGALLHGGNTTLADCVFIENGSGIAGGGVALSFSATASLSGCRFEGNTAVSGGGAINAHVMSNSLIEDCVFKSNSIARLPIAANGGAIYFNQGTHTVRRSRFEGNAAQSNGAVGVQSGASAEFEACEFVGNECDVAGGAAGVSGASASFSDCLFQENEAGVGGGLYASSGVTVERCEFRANFTHAPTNYAGGAYLTGGGSEFTECDFVMNTANTAAAVQLSGSGHRFDRCRFLGNSASATGGALWHASGSADYTNCLFADNTAGFFASVLFLQGSSGASMINCTVADNAGSFGALHAGTGTSLALANCIVRNAGPEFNAGAVVTATYSNIEDGFAGAGNIDADPLFVGSGDYSLDAGSPCIDAGSNSAVPVGKTLDLAGGARFADDAGTTDTGEGAAPVVDMGAFERAAPGAPCLGDANGDGVVDFNDITSALSNWLADYGLGTGPGDANHDGVVDFNDITAVLSNWLQQCP